MELSLNNLSFRYSRKKPFVLDDVSFNFADGGVCGLLGPNGAGKSTLLYLIAGLLTPSNGDVSFNGTPTSRRRPDVLAKIFLVPEEPSLPAMSIRRYVELNAPFYPNFSIDLLKEALNDFNVDCHESLHTLSMGQKKKVVLSFALACRTPVLLMDEPTNGLDIPGKAAFRRLVAKYASDDKLFLISTHQVRDLDQLLDRIMIMDTHRFLLNETVARLEDLFAFKSSLRDVPENAIFSIPSLGGFDVMLPNENEDDTRINLELLFEAVLKNNENIRQVIETQQSIMQDAQI